MQFKQILLLIVLCCSAILFVYIDSDNIGTKDKIKFKNRIIRSESSEIKNIIISNINIVRNNKIWEIIYPVETGIDKDNFEYFFSTLIGLNKINEYKIKYDKELIKYKINFDSEIVVINKELEKIKLYPGTKNFDNTYFLYVLPDNKIYNTKTNLTRLFSKTLYELRTKQIYDFISSDIKKISVETDTKYYEIVKLSKEKYDYEWQIKKPVEKSADWIKINDFVDTIIYIEPDKFVDNTENLNKGSEVLTVKFDIQDDLFELKIFNTENQEYFYCEDNINKFGFYISQTKFKSIKILLNFV